MNKFLRVLVAAGAGAAAVGAKVETVPCSGRRQLLLPTGYDETKGNAVRFAEKKGGIVLPRWHWRSIRARRVADRLLRAMEEDELSGRMSSSAKQFLKELNWEVVVVKGPEPDFSACYIGGGKILISASLLYQFWREDEIATIIGHEMSHCIARHKSECFSLILMMILSGCAVFISVTWVKFACFIILLRYAFWLPFNRRLEKEADYIGLLLMAQAGFNPQVAPTVYKRLNPTDKKWKAYRSTHPTGMERAETLSQDHVMSEETKIYKQKKPASWYSKVYKFFTCYFGV